MRFPQVCLSAAIGFAAVGCTSDPRISKLELRDGDDQSASLGAAPYRVEFEADKYGGVFQEDVDLGMHDPEQPVTVFMRSSKFEGSLSAVDLATGEIYDGKLIGVVEGDSGPRYITRMEVDPSLVEGMRVSAEFAAYAELNLWMCDELVVNRNDAGPGSLRQAIADVRDDGSVCFDPVEFDNGVPVELDTQILVSKSVHICGTGWYGSHVMATEDERVFEFESGTDSSLIDLTLRRGSEAVAGSGGLVLNSGKLTLDGAQLHSGKATLAGGAIFNRRRDEAGTPPDDGVLVIGDSSLRYNQAEEGGGIFNARGSVVVVGSWVAHNTAQTGGGIHSYEGLLVRIGEGTLVHNNDAEDGGGLYIYEENIDTLSGENEIDRGMVTANAALRGGGAFVHGAFLLVARDAPGIGQPAALSGNLAELGGGAYVEGGGVQVMPNASITSNTAREQGGGVYRDFGAVFDPEPSRIHANVPDDVFPPQ